MSTIKISDLTAAGTLAGTEILPTVQSGATKKITLSQLLTYIEDIGLGTLDIDGINLGGSLSTLSNFETGTYNAQFDFVTATYSAQTSTYQRIGDLVICQHYIDVSSIDNTDSSSIALGGLPFDIENDFSPVINFDFNASTLYGFTASDSVHCKRLADTRVGISDTAGTLLRYNDGIVNSSGISIATITYLTKE